MKNIHSGHRERLRKRFNQSGLEAFEPHNALELILFYAYSRSDTNELAHTLIQKFGGLTEVFDAPYDELLKIKGVGERTATFIKMLPQFASYYIKGKVKLTSAIDSTEIAGRYFIPKFIGKTEEEVYLLSLDDKKRPIRCVKLITGTVNAASITVRKIVAEAVNSGATGVILSHNHPSGVAIPSTNDVYVTTKIKNALELINIQLIDHIIVSDNDFVSFADSGHFNY